MVKSGLNVRKEIEKPKKRYAGAQRWLTDTQRGFTTQTTLSTTIGLVIMRIIFHPHTREYSRDGTVDMMAVCFAVFDADMAISRLVTLRFSSFSFSHIPVSVREEDYA